MKRIVAWLETKLSWSNSASRSNAPESARHGDMDLGVDLPKEIRGMLNDVPIPGNAQLSAKNASMPDIYADDCETTVPDLRTLDADTSPGSNPYDTAKLHKK